MRFGRDDPEQRGWRGPDQRARPGLPQTPGGRALHPVIMAAPRGDIARAGETALVVGDRVVEIAPRRWAAADREPADLVTDLDQVPHPIRDLVYGDRVGVRTRSVVIAGRVMAGRVMAGRMITGRMITGRSAIVCRA